MGVGKYEWNYRIIDMRPVLVESLDDGKREIGVVDLKVNLPFVLEVPEGVSMDPIKEGEEYLAMLKVYTAELKDKMIVKELIEFFKVIDVERRFEEFLKVSFIDKSLVKFELIEMAPL